jgi:hypothetical protein
MWWWWTVVKRSVKDSAVAAEMDMFMFQSAVSWTPEMGSSAFINSGEQ